MKLFFASFLVLLSLNSQSYALDCNSRLNEAIKLYSPLSDELNVVNDVITQEVDENLRKFKETRNLDYAKGYCKKMEEFLTREWNLSNEATKIIRLDLLNCPDPTNPRKLRDYNDIINNVQILQELYNTYSTIYDVYAKACPTLTKIMDKWKNPLDIK